MREFFCVTIPTTINETDAGSMVGRLSFFRGNIIFLMEGQVSDEAAADVLDVFSRDDRVRVVDGKSTIAAVLKSLSQEINLSAA